MRSPRAVIWLDRDGTILDDPGYLADPAGLVLLPGAARAIARLRSAGCAVVLISNQSGIGRGLLGEADLEAIHAELRRRLGLEGAALDGLYHCPHLPPELLTAGELPCACRKPEPGLVLRARREMGLVGLPEAVVGDKQADLSLARAVGAKAVLVLTGEGPATLRGRGRDDACADHVADDVLAAVPWLLDALGLTERGP